MSGERRSGKAGNEVRPANEDASAAPQPGHLRVAFAELSLAALDAATVDSIGLLVGEDDRPLTGLGQLCDWRLCGGLSRMLREGTFRGAEGEALLMPGRPRLAVTRLFLFGRPPAGASGLGYGPMLTALGRARVESVGLEPPPMPEPDQVAAFLEALAPLEGKKVVLFGATAELKRMLKSAR